MFTWISNSLLPLVGNVVCYIVALVEMPEAALQYALLGNSFEWQVVNFATGSPVACTFVSYDYLLNFVRDIPIVGDIVYSTLEFLLDGVGSTVYSVIFQTSPYNTNPLWFSLLIGFFKLFLIFCIVRIALKLIMTKLG